MYKWKLYMALKWVVYEQGNILCCRSNHKVCDRKNILDYIAAPTNFTTNLCPDFLSNLNVIANILRPAGHHSYPMHRKKRKLIPSGEMCVQQINMSIAINLPVIVFMTCRYIM